MGTPVYKVTCFSGPPVLQYLGAHHKCQLSGPIPDLLAQSLPCNEISTLFYTHYHLKSTDIGNIPFVCLPIFIDGGPDAIKSGVNFVKIDKFQVIFVH